MRPHWILLLFAPSAGLATVSAALNASLGNTTAHGTALSTTAAFAANVGAPDASARGNATHHARCVPPHEEPSKFEGESYLLTSLGLGLHIHNKTGHVCKSRNNGRFDAWHIERKGCTGNKYIFRSEFGYLGLEPKPRTRCGEASDLSLSVAASYCRAAAGQAQSHAYGYDHARAQGSHDAEQDQSDKKQEKSTDYHGKKRLGNQAEYKLIGNATEPIEWSVFILLPGKQILLSHKKMVLTFDSRCLALSPNFAAAKLLKIQNLKASDDEDE